MVQSFLGHELMEFAFHQRKALAAEASAAVVVRGLGLPAQSAGSLQCAPMSSEAP